MARRAADPAVNQLDALDVLEVRSPADVGPTGANTTTSQDAPRGRTRTRSRRWPWVAAAVLVLAGLLAFPVRTRLAAAELARLDRRWQEAVAIDNDRNAVVSRVDELATPDDGERVTHASLALDLEVAGRLRAIRRSIGGEHTVDGGMRRLARLERRAIDARVAELQSHHFGLFDYRAVDAELNHQRARLRHDPAPPAPGAHAPLHAADADIAALSHWLDEPTGAVVVVPSDQLQVLDVDHSTVQVVPDVTGNGPVERRRGWLADLTAGHVVAIPFEHGRLGAAKPIGPADYFFSGLRDDTVWLVTHDDALAAHASEVDSDGTVIRSITAPRRGLEPVGETDAGVLLSDPGNTGPGLSVLRPDGSPGPALPGVGLPFAVSGLVAWVDTHTPDHQLHLWSPATGVDRPIPTPAGYEVRDVGTFSPGNRLLTVFFEPATAGGGLLRVGIIDVQTAAITMADPLPGTTSPRAVAWSPDGERLFVSALGPHPVTTYRLGDTRIRQLRFGGMAVNSMAVIDAG